VSRSQTSANDETNSAGFLLGACAAVAFALCLLFGPGTAAAAPTAVSAYAYSHSFANEGQVESGVSIAVEPGSGNILVGDAYQGHVAVFAPDAAPADPPLTSFAGASTAIAIDKDNGDIYMIESSFGPLGRWTSDGAPVPTYTRDPGYAPTVNDYSGRLAVDPTTGDLLVVESNAGEVTRFDPDGNRLSSFRTFVGFTIPTAITVGEDGKLYVLDAGWNLVRTFTATGEPLGNLPVQGRPLQLATDPQTGAINVIAEVSGARRIEGFDSSGTLIYEVPFPASMAGVETAGIAVGGSGSLYVLTGGSTGVHVFDPATYPGVEAPAVSEITTTSAHVSAEVDPGAGPPSGSSAHFEYSADGGDTWSSTPDQDDTAGPTIAADIAGLGPNVEYLVRAVAGNDQIAHTSPATSFTTVGVVPAVATGAATDLSETTAVVNGTINPVGLQSTYHFEYGLTAAYGSRLPAGIDAVSGNGRTARIFSRTLEDLQPGTTYHYRLVAENAIGVSQGEDRTFTTLTAGAIPVRGYEQVTPVDKHGASVDATVGFQAAADGSAISYITRSPAEANSSPLFARFLSRRGSTDWHGGIPTDPPLNVVRNTVFITTLAVSPDFEHAFVMSNRKLAPGGIENSANLYVQDLETGEYTLVTASEALGVFNVFTTAQTQNKFLYGNADFSKLVFGSPIPLLPEVTESALYSWTAAEGLQLASVMPDGSAPEGEVVLAAPSGDIRYVSEDSNRVYFAIANGSDAGVYLREDGQTRPISVSRRAGDPETPQAGLFMGTSKDGRYGYFFTYSAQLTEDSPAFEGNVYRYDAVEDELVYLGGQAGPGFSPSNIAALAVSDDGETFYFAGRNGVEVWRDGAIRLVGGTSVTLGGGFLSPNGRYFAFGNYGDAVYLYDYEAEQLFCASCLSDGSNPGGAQLPESERQASNLIPEAVTDQGEVFFDTTARLVAADVNGESDVYELKNGKARLISPGDEPFAAHYGDISNGGKDVFFTTAQPLVSRDEDQSIDIYDARIGGGLPAQSPPPPKVCLRDDCKATPSAGPELPFGGSEAINGSANVKPKKGGKSCGKGRRLRKVNGKKRCVRKHPKKASNHRRTAR
jgi:hypothetical protein